VNLDLLSNGVSPDAFRAAKRADAKALASFRREMRNLAKTFGIDKLHQDVVNHFVEQARDTLQFQQGDTPLENAALTALTGVVGQPVERGFSAAELAAIEQQREARASRQAAEAKKARPQIKTEYQIALDMAERQLQGPLDERDAQWLKRYLHSHQLMAKRLEKDLAILQQKRASAAE